MKAKNLPYQAVRLNRHRYRRPGQLRGRCDAERLVEDQERQQDGAFEPEKSTDPTLAHGVHGYAAPTLQGCDF